MQEKWSQTLFEHGYSPLRQLGAGSYACVYLCKSEKYQEEFAVKIEENGTEITEIKLLMSLDHPNIIRIYETFTDQEKKVVFIIMEYCPGGNMKSFIHYNGGLEAASFMKVAREIISALKVCHDMAVAHRDIKPENIIIDSNKRAKLCDFGMGVKFFDNIDGQKTIFRGGSLPYMAPEILLGQCTDPFSSDIYSLGITFLTIVNGRLPWSCQSREGIKREILTSNIMYGTKLDSNLRGIIKQMCSQNPKERPSISDLFCNVIFFPIQLATRSGRKLTIGKSKVYRRSMGILPQASIFMLKRVHGPLSREFVTSSKSFANLENPSILSD